MSRTTKDPELAEGYMHDAEQLNAQIHGLEQEYAEARDQLDSFQAESAWIDVTLKQIYEHSLIHEMPLPEDVRAFPLEERRLLLAAFGLRAEVYPTNWQGKRCQGGTGSKERVEVFFSWELDQELLRT